MTADQFDTWAQKTIDGFNYPEEYKIIYLHDLFVSTFLDIDASDADKAFLNLKYSEYLI